MIDSLEDRIAALPVLRLDLDFSSLDHSVGENRSQVQDSALLIQGQELFLYVEGEIAGRHDVGFLRGHLPNKEIINIGFEV